MEDVITDITPPSRFLLEDLNNFTLPSPCLPSPFVVFSASDVKKPLCPSVLIIAMSSPSLCFFDTISSKTLIGTLILPEIPFSGNSIEPSLRDKSCNIYTLNDADNLIVTVPVQYSVTAERSHAVAKLLIDEQIVPDRVLILDSVQRQNFRDKLSPDERFAFKLETSSERKGLGDDCGDSTLLKGLDYFPSGSVVDSLAAALLGRCQMKKIKGTLCVSWPDFGNSVMLLVKSLLLKHVLPGLEYSTDGTDEECSRLGRIKSQPLDSEFIITSLHASDPPLTLDYYASTCPTFLEIVRKEMECAVLSDPRNAALILRLHFHDCFVQGCDASVLLDDTITLQGEKKAPINLKALKGFRIIDRIKNKLESECPGIVSCADILTIAARDAVILVGGPYWDVPVGRKDSKTAGYALASTNIPSSDEGLLSIISKFLYQGLSVTDMVALSGAHTIGMARCVNFRARIYGDFEATSGMNPISETYLSNLKSICPAAGGGDNNETAMDYVTPNLFDNSFYHLLLKGEGLLNSDQELYTSVFGIETKELVQKYAEDAVAFFQQFSESMVKLGNIANPETYVDGEVRKNCRFVNT
ncbi:hypothetical protein F0562_033066 [Nyssa sinensis]|uniref:peroxidase n=1 Tax=Nyssa sinensis TaxID=561372 RepID=A0A5J5ATS4_9ASTE|nr:hypothetical protein F0562_033066 [Nyssa sinensis]